MKISNAFHALHVKIGHCFYNASISLKNLGERSRFSPFIGISNAWRELAMKFPVK